MDQQIVMAISEQYGAAFKMLGNNITGCPDDLWNDTTKDMLVSQVVYHVLFFIDFYLSKDKKEREQFEKSKGKLGDDLMGEKIDGKKWDKIYTKQELLEYLGDMRQKTQNRFTNLTFEELQHAPVFEWHGSSVLSSLLYDLRHVMLHVGALHVRVNAVRQEPMKWVSVAPIIE